MLKHLYRNPSKRSLKHSGLIFTKRCKTFYAENSLQISSAKIISAGISKTFTDRIFHENIFQKHSFAGFYTEKENTYFLLPFIKNECIKSKRLMNLLALSWIIKISFFFSLNSYLDMSDTWRAEQSKETVNRRIVSPCRCWDYFFFYTSTVDDVAFIAQNINGWFILRQLQ